MLLKPLGYLQQLRRAYLKLPLQKFLNGGYVTRVSTVSTFVLLVTGGIGTYSKFRETMIGDASLVIAFVSLLVFGLDHHVATRRALPNKHMAMPLWFLFTVLILVIILMVLGAYIELQA